MEQVMVSFQMFLLNERRERAVSWERLLEELVGEGARGGDRGL